MTAWILLENVVNLLLNTERILTFRSTSIWLYGASNDKASHVTLSSHLYNVQLSPKLVIQDTPPQKEKKKKKKKR